MQSDNCSYFFGHVAILLLIWPLRWILQHIKSGAFRILNAPDVWFLVDRERSSFLWPTTPQSRGSSYTSSLRKWAWTQAKWVCHLNPLPPRLQINLTLSSWGPRICTASLPSVLKLFSEPSGSSNQNPPSFAGRDLFFVLRSCRLLEVHQFPSKQEGFRRIFGPILVADDLECSSSWLKDVKAHNLNACSLLCFWTAWFSHTLVSTTSGVEPVYRSGQLMLQQVYIVGEDGIEKELEQAGIQYLGGMVITLSPEPFETNFTFFSAGWDFSPVHQMEILTK